jgi:hypothetical protein
MATGQSKGVIKEFPYRHRLLMSWKVMYGIIMNNYNNNYDMNGNVAELVGNLL